MFNPTKSWAALLGLVALGATFPTACGDMSEMAGTGDSSTSLYDVAGTAVAAYVEVVGPEVVLPLLVAFEGDVATLATAIDDWQLAFEGATDPLDAQRTAQDAWRTAMATWQQLEVMQIGPAASSLVDGGDDLRDEIYSWPTVNPCRVDQETAADAGSSPTFFDDALVNAYGLDALERVLFAGPDNACPVQVAPNADGSWDALGEQGVLRARAAFARVLAGGLQASTQELISAWNGDFGATFAETPTSLGAVFDAMFYLEAATKDRKLAQPLGLIDCAADTCPEDVETPLSETSLDWVIANLAGFERLFAPDDNLGFPAILEASGNDSLANDITAAIDDAVSVAEALDGSLTHLIDEEPQRVQALHDAVKTITDLLKGDLSTALMLEIPQELSGDND